MRYMKYFALLAVMMVMPLAYSQAQVEAGVGAGNNPAYADQGQADQGPADQGYANQGYVGPGYAAGPPVCAYGYYGYYPYACAPYGYYGPDWFAGGIFVGAGPWFHGPGWLGHWGWANGWYGRPWFGHPGWGRAWYGGGYGRGYVGVRTRLRRARLRRARLRRTRLCRTRLCRPWQCPRLRWWRIPWWRRGTQWWWIPWRRRLPRWRTRWRRTRWWAPVTDLHAGRAKRLAASRCQPFFFAFNSRP